LLPNIKFYYNYLIYNNYNYYKPFHLKLNTMYKRLKSKKNVKEINEKKLIKSVDDKLDLAHNRIKFFDNSVSLLFGYKLQFNGRFTRKQKSANVWFLKGSLYNSSMKNNVDYASNYYTFRYSKCSVKVWLFKNNKYPLYSFRVV